MSEQSKGRRFRASDEERDYVLHLLQQAHAAGRLDVEELHDRQDAAFAARFTDEFIPLLDDLPEGQEVVAILRPRPEPRPRGRGVARFFGPTPRGSGQSTAILSGRKLVAEPGTTHFHLMSFMGGDTLDLSEAMAPGVVFVLESEAVLGGATIRVPRGVHVVDETTNVMGGSTVRRSARGDGSNGTLVLRGICILGGHTVKLR